MQEVQARERLRELLGGELREIDISDVMRVYRGLCVMAGWEPREEWVSEEIEEYLSGNAGALVARLADHETFDLHPDDVSGHRYLAAVAALIVSLRGGSADWAYRLEYGAYHDILAGIGAIVAGETAAFLSNAVRRALCAGSCQ